ncbi:hypothetical protein GCM10009682_43150 [Luedemannella flava]|uniref:FlgN protein n=1 Tax=Luedemannella flava TaxID=349316 RepID=A0ABN2MAW1_9ACTN
MSLYELSTILWRTRELLELLLFKLEEEQLLLAAGPSRWLAHATREVEVVLEELRAGEVARSAHSQAVALALQLPPDASLAQIADAAPEPWNDLLLDHRRAFLTLTGEITALAATNREMLSAGQRAAREALLVVAGTVETYSPQGRTVAGARRPSLIDEAL